MNTPHILPLFLLAAASLAAPRAAAQQTLSLRQCIERAIERNISVQQAEVARQQQEIAVNSADNARLPELSAGANENLSFGRGLTMNNTYESRNTSSTGINIGASLPLYTGGRITTERQRARLNLAAATADIESLREDLALNITQSYLQAVSYADMVEQAKATLALSERQEQRVRQQIEAGKLPGADLPEATSRIAQDRLSLVQTESNYRISLLALSQLLELPSPDSLSLVRPTEEELKSISGNPEDIYLLALTDRPKLRAANLRIQAAEKEIELARAGLRPNLSLTAGMGTSYYHTSGMTNTSFGRQVKDNFSQSIGLNLSIPIFDRFSTRNNVRSARLNILDRQLALDDARKTLYKEVQNAYYNALSAQQRYHAATEAERAAEAALTAITLKYENGRANATEFDQIKLKHFNAVTDRITARYEYLFRTKILDFYRGTAL